MLSDDALLADALDDILSSAAADLTESEQRRFFREASRRLTETAREIFGADWQPTEPCPPPRMSRPRRSSHYHRAAGIAPNGRKQGGTFHGPPIIPRSRDRLAAALTELESAHTRRMQAAAGGIIREFLSEVERLPSSSLTS